MIQPILIYPDPKLSQTADPVGAVGADIQILAADLLETMYDAEGRGLAAPQIGDGRRVFVMDAGWKDGDRRPVVMVNPEVVEASAETSVAKERCLSIPDDPREVERPERVKLSWTDLSGVRQEEWLEGAASRIAQHELDHLDGVLILDRAA